MARSNRCSAGVGSGRTPRPASGAPPGRPPVPRPAARSGTARSSAARAGAPAADSWLRGPGVHPQRRRDDPAPGLPQRGLRRHTAASPQAGPPQHAGLARWLDPQEPARARASEPRGTSRPPGRARSRRARSCLPGPGARTGPHPGARPPGGGCTRPAESARQVRWPRPQGPYAAVTHTRQGCAGRHREARSPQSS